MSDPPRQEFDDPAAGHDASGARERVGGSGVPHHARADWLYLLPVGPGAAALDLGSEGGELTVGLSRLCDRVIAVEPDPVLARATADAAARGGAGNVRVMCAGGEQLTFRPGCFDVIVCQRPERMLGRLGVAGAAEALAALASAQGCVAISVGAGAQAWAQNGRREGRPSREPRTAHAPRGHFRLAALTRALLDCGFREVKALAALPGTATAACVFPVDQRVPYREAIRQVISGAAGPAGVWRAAVLRAAASVAGGAAGRAVLPAFWVIARSPANLRAVLAEEVLRSIAAQRPWLDAHRTDPAQRARSVLRNRSLAFSVLREAPGCLEHATYLAFPQGWRAPACVLQIGRSQPMGDALARAGEALLLLRSRVAPELREAIPIPIGAGSIRGQGALAECYQEGITLHQRVQSARRARLRPLIESVLPMAADWLADLNLQTASRIWTQGFECERALSRLVCSPPGGAPLPAPFEALLRWVAEAGTRLGVAHNNLMPCSLLLRPSGLAVRHWAGLTFDDLPLMDFYSLVTSLGRLLVRRRCGGARRPRAQSEPEAAAEAAAAVFAFTFAESTWYSRLVARAVHGYCERAGLPLETAYPYLPLAYLRRALRADRDDPKGDEAAASYRLASLALEWQPEW